MSETLFFNRYCHFSAMQEAAYRVEIDTQFHARFYTTTEPSRFFYEELMFRPSHKLQMIRYVSLVLKSLTDHQY